MKEVYHILNGDSLKVIFPKNVKGKKYICRECLVDGNVQGENLEEFFQNRAIFINSYFPENKFSLTEYKSVSDEFFKILDIAENAEINLWFEEDLFCQVNLWFILYLLKSNSRDYSINLVLPHKDFKYSFYGMSTDLLENSYETNREISELGFRILSKFWELFQKNNYSEIENLVNRLDEKYQFMIPALNAWKENRVAKALKEILKDPKMTKFEAIINEFAKREAVYGFGDLQVKRILKILGKDF